jgi:hypothetical protein
MNIMWSGEKWTPGVKKAHTCLCKLTTGEKETEFNQKDIWQFFKLYLSGNLKWKKCQVSKGFSDI